MQCAKWGKQKFDDGLIGIIGMGVVDEKRDAKYEDYCFDCGMEELRKSLKGVPVTIECPHYPEYTGEELQKHGAAINYTTELIDYPPYNNRRL